MNTFSQYLVVFCVRCCTECMLNFSSQYFSLPRKKRQQQHKDNTSKNVAQCQVCTVHCKLSSVIAAQQRYFNLMDCRCVHQKESYLYIQVITTCIQVHIQSQKLVSVVQIFKPMYYTTKWLHIWCFSHKNEHSGRVFVFCLFACLF